jgi:hypothetical protein
VIRQEDQMNITCTRTLLAFAALTGFLPMIALADETAELRPTGKTVITYRAKRIELKKPATVALQPGDQLCVMTGKLEVRRSNGKLALEAGKCLQVAPPRNDAESVLGFVKSLVNNPKSYDTQGAQSRDPNANGPTPTLNVPQSYALATLSLPISGRPNPKVLKLLDATGKTLLTLESNDDESVFQIPSVTLKKTRRLEVRGADKQVLYAASVFQVEFANLPNDPLEAAKRLLETRSIEYAPAAYSLLLKAGSNAEASELEAHIRSNFAGNDSEAVSSK